MIPVRALFLVLLLSAPLATTASATHDACRVEDVEGQPRCLVDFARNERCIYNPVAYVLPGEPTYIC